MSDNELPTYRPNALVAPLSVAQRPGEVDRVNALLDGADLGRPIGAPEEATSGLALLPVTAADPLAVVTKLRQLAAGSDSLAAQVDVDPLLRAATYERNAMEHEIFPAKDIGHVPAADKNIGHVPAADKNIGHLPAADKNIGHVPAADKDIGHVAWVSQATGPDPVPWQPAGAANRRVVVLLDTGVVADHWWLKVSDSSDPFVVDAAQSGWRPPAPLPPPAAGRVGSHLGHGTFNAGLIRQTAPRVKVLSFDVMSDTGLVSEVAVIAALEWLTTSHQRVDAIVMPFGRRETAGDYGLTRRHLEAALTRLDDRIRIVAAVGSDGVNTPTFPAADRDAQVIGVGSGASAVQPDYFSAHSTRADVWDSGKDVVSILPVTTLDGTGGFAKWSGTAFAAVKHAARIAGS